MSIIHTDTNQSWIILKQQSHGAHVMHDTTLYNLAADHFRRGLPPKNMLHVLEIPTDAPETTKGQNSTPPGLPSKPSPFSRPLKSGTLRTTTLHLPTVPLSRDNDISITTQGSW